MAGSDHLEKAALSRAPQGPACPAGAESWLLTERVKELNCLYGISRVFERSASGELCRTLQAVVELVPAAWQHPDVTVARLDIESRSFESKGFTRTEWIQEAPIILQGRVAGAITVCYLEERPEQDEGPFLVEERNLLNTISLRLGAFVERQQVREQLAHYQHDLRDLAAQLAMSEQRERRSLAESLHDRIGQSLALIKLRLGQLRAVASPESDLFKGISEVEVLLTQVILDTRSLTFELCPPILYELGLGPALEWLGERAEREYGFAVSVDTDAAPSDLSEELRVTLFQVAGELMTNVAKYAKARAVSIGLSATNLEVKLTVRDDGVGIADSETAHRTTKGGGFGLFNIRERVSWLGGRFELESTLGSGTTATVVVPRMLK